MSLHFLEGATNVRWRHFITFTWQMPNKHPRSFQKVNKVKGIFIIILRYYLPLSLSFIITQLDIPVAMWCMKMKNIDCRRKIQFSSIKKEIKEICKNVKQWHFSLFFLENKDFKNENVLFILHAMSLSYKNIINFRNSQLKNLIWEILIDKIHINKNLCRVLNNFKKCNVVWSKNLKTALTVNSLWI